MREIKGLAVGVRVMLRIGHQEPPTPALPHGGERELPGGGRVAVDGAFAVWTV
jgi:hypothetical protein